MTSRKKVAVILPNSEKCCPVMGGALAKWTREIYAKIADRAECTVYAPGFDSAPQSYTKCKIKPPRLANFFYSLIRERSIKGVLEKPKMFLRSSYNRKAAAIARKRRPQIIHIQNDPVAAIIFRQYLPNSRIILHMHNDHLIEGESARQIAEKSVTCSDEVYFCSHHIREKALAQIPILTNKFSAVIRNGANILETSRLKNRIALLEPESPRLLFVGRITPEKGVHLLVNAFSEILKASPKATLRIVGGINFGSSESSPYFDSIKRQAEQFGSSIVFSGPLSHTETMSCFVESDIFVCPSIWDEPMGMVNIEAMACGVPVVTFPKGGILETVGNAAWLATPCDATGLARGVIELIRNSKLRQHLTIQGYNRVKQNYQWSMIAEEWLAILNSTPSDD